MKKIEGFIAIAPKLESGNLEYCLWADDDGALYVQIVRNLTNTKSPGTHPKLIFRISDYLDEYKKGNALREMHGINPETFCKEISDDNDSAGFVKAIMRHLFPKKQ